MQYNLTRPCKNCPFLKAKGAVRLSEARAMEIGEMMLSSQGGEFTCHKTSSSTNDVPKDMEQHCAGAIAFAFKHDNMTQMMRITQRLGMFNTDDFEGIDPDTIIDEPLDMAE